MIIDGNRVKLVKGKNVNRFENHKFVGRNEIENLIFVFFGFRSRSGVMVINLLDPPEYQYNPDKVETEADV